MLADPRTGRWALKVAADAVGVSINHLSTYGHHDEAYNQGVAGVVFGLLAKKWALHEIAELLDRTPEQVAAILADKSGQMFPAVRAISERIKTGKKVPAGVDLTPSVRDAYKYRQLPESGMLGRARARGTVRIASGATFVHWKPPPANAVVQDDISTMRESPAP